MPRSNSTGVELWLMLVYESPHSFCFTSLVRVLNGFSFKHRALTYMSSSHSLNKWVLGSQAAWVLIGSQHMMMNGPVLPSQSSPSNWLSGHVNSRCNTMWHNKRHEQRQRWILWIWADAIQEVTFWDGVKVWIGVQWSTAFRENQVEEISLTKA